MLGLAINKYAIAPIPGSARIAKIHASVSSTPRLLVTARMMAVTFSAVKRMTAIAEGPIVRAVFYSRTSSIEAKWERTASRTYGRKGYRAGPAQRRHVANAFLQSATICPMRQWTAPQTRLCIPKTHPRPGA
jgi:hypothetical protein